MCVSPRYHPSVCLDSSRTRRAEPRRTRHDTTPPATGFFANRSRVLATGKRHRCASGTGITCASRPPGSFSSTTRGICVTMALRTSLIACATTSKPLLGVERTPRAADIASPRLCSLPKPTDFAEPRIAGIDAAAFLDDTPARADATTFTAQSALAEIAAMMVGELDVRTRGSATLIEESTANSTAKSNSR